MSSLIMSRLLSAVVLSSATFLTACGGSSTDTASNNTSSVDLPDEKTLVFVDANSPKQYLYNTTSEKSTDLNADSTQNYYLGDTSQIGHFLFWPDDSNGDGEVNEEKILMMKSTYTDYATIDSDQFLYLAHYHGTEFDGHASTEFANPVEGSAISNELKRLNTYVTKQKKLFDEVNEALQADTTAAGETLCRAFVDPHAGHEHSETTTTKAETATTVAHFALTKSGRLYFYKEGDSGLTSMQGFVALEGISQINDCHKATMTRADDDGILVFVADSQKLYLIDSHGGDYHQHSQVSLSEFMPAGFHADFMAAIGEGAEHDHE